MVFLRSNCLFLQFCLADAKKCSKGGESWWPLSYSVYFYIYYTCCLWLRFKHMILKKEPWRKNIPSSELTSTMWIMAYPNRVSPMIPKVVLNKIGHLLVGKQSKRGWETLRCCHCMRLRFYSFEFYISASVKAEFLHFLTNKNSYFSSSWEPKCWRCCT